jgi:CRP/FNR family cyclic AMP-dependent transcriptional regulator
MDTQPPHTATPWAEGPQFNECLRDLPAEVAQALTDVATKRLWRRGDVVIRQGQHQGTVVVCQQGRLAVMVAGPSGSDTLLRFVLKGELMGLPSVLADTPASTSIVASGSAETLHIERSAFFEVLRKYPEGAIGVAVLLSHRLAEVFRFVEMTSHRTLTERVTYALRRLARRNGEPDTSGSTKLKVTQDELATAAGASRQRVHLELKRLQSLGLISLGYGEIVIKTDKL